MTRLWFSEREAFEEKIETQIFHPDSSANTELPADFCRNSTPLLPALKSRRQFFLDCSTLTLAAGWLPAALAEAVSAKTPVRAAGFADFAAQRGTFFTVSSSARRAVRLQLLAVESNTSPRPPAHLAPDAANEKFTLIFQGAGRVGLAQATYTFDHPQLGWQEIFIVPARLDGSEQDHYAAVFNRPNPAI
jgi:Domain of unknown function (DUF6916)